MAKVNDMFGAVLAMCLKEVDSALDFIRGVPWFLVGSGSNQVYAPFLERIDLSCLVRNMILFLRSVVLLTALSCQHLREVTLESRKREQKAQHRDEALNESLRRVRVDFERHSSEAEGRIAQLKVVV